MRTTLKIWGNTLWQDERGFVQPSQTILMVAILVIGMIAGLTTLRDQLVQEMGDTAVALESLDQSYSFTIHCVDHDVVSTFVDSNTLTDPDGEEPAGISVTEAPIEEGDFTGLAGEEGSFGGP